jgi:hypothetical protein
MGQGVQLVFTACLGFIYHPYAPGPLCPSRGWLVHRCIKPIDAKRLKIPREDGLQGGVALRSQVGSAGEVKAYDNSRQGREQFVAVLAV